MTYLGRPSKKFAFSLAGAFLCIFSTAAQSAPIILDFENFNVGDDLTTVNAFSSPLGATFSAVFPLTFTVIQDPNNASNKILSSQTLPTNADILINFASAVDFVMVDFVDNAQGLNLGTALEAFDQNNASTLLPLLGNGTFVSGTEPGFLQINTPGILSLQIESASNFVLIDNIQFGSVPEPSSLSLFGIALAGLLGFARWKKRAIKDLSA